MTGMMWELKLSSRGAALDPFLVHLIAINVLAFVAFVIDFLLCMWKPEPDETTANSLVMDIFPIAGGALGMPTAPFALGRIGRGHRMNKDNVAWWFLAIVCLVVWGLVVAAHFGFVRLDSGLAGILSGWNLDRLRILGIYLAAINVVTFVAFAWDKHVAANGNDYRRRAPEARLLGLGLVGGSLGGLLAMNVVRHKTRKWYFVWGMPLFFALDVALLLFAHAAGVV